jgi:hypothetical protein
VDTLQLAGAGAGARGTHTSAAVRGPPRELSAAPSSIHGRSSTTSKTKKRSWAKAPKVPNKNVPKGQEVMYGQTVAQETDKWTKYSHDLARPHKFHQEEQAASQYRQ